MAGGTTTTAAITLDDIDPELARRVRRRAAEVAERLRPEVNAASGRFPAGSLDALVYGRETLRRSVSLFATLAWAISVVCLLLSVFKGADHPWYTIVGGSLILPAAPLLLLKRYQDRRDDRDYQRALLRIALPLVAKTRAETLYSEFVQSLRKSPDGGGATPPLELLRHANLLMDSSHVIERALEDLKTVLGGETQFSLEAERRKLLRRAEEAADPAARDALLRGAELCAARAETAGRFAALSERLNAQQEVICQTLASLHTSAAHARLAPNLAAAAAATTGAGGLPQMEVQEAVAEIQRHARAVEEAVQEVAALRAGGGG